MSRRSTTACPRATDTACRRTIGRGSAGQECGNFNRLTKGARALSIPITYSLLRYLAAKKSVDDRALNWRVWQRLVEALPRVTTEQPLHILEVGAGIGSM